MINKISIIIPVYNEEKTVKEIVRRVNAVEFGNIKKEIIVVDDGSTDSSPEIIKKIKGIISIKHKKNMGNGSAIRTGLKSATGDIIAIQDADLELNPSDLVLLAGPVINNKVLAVSGTRYPKYKNNLENSFFFYNGGRMVTWIANFLYGSDLTDVPCGYKLFKKEAIEGIHLECKKFDFCPEFTAKLLKKGIKIIEIPVSYSPRSKKEGKKLRYRDGLKAILILIKNRLP